MGGVGGTWGRRWVGQEVDGTGGSQGRRWVGQEVGGAERYVCRWDKR